MRKQALILILFALVLGLSIPALAQTGTVKGFVKDQGKPIVGAQVEMVNTDNGRKVSLKTDKGGNFFSIGVPMGTYNITISQDGKQIWNASKYQVQVGDNQPIEVDLAKERASNANNPANAEQAAKIEAAKKENEKIGNLNTLLKQAQEAMQANNWDQAIQLMQQAAQADQTHDIIFGKLGDAYLGAKKYPESIEAYQKAIQLDPNKAAYHNNMAQALAKSNQTDKAIAEYDTAAKMEPAQAATYYFNEGAVLTNTGKLDDANAAFDKAIAADPNKADAYYWKGINLMGKAKTGADGKFEAPAGTAEAFNKYLELQPDGKYAQPAKDMLASIGAKVETSFGSGKKSSKPVKK